MLLKLSTRENWEFEIKFIILHIQYFYSMEHEKNYNIEFTSALYKKKYLS